MPVPSFLSSFADKAQSAINASPLAGHIQVPGVQSTSSPEPSANESTSKSRTLESIQHQFRSLQQQYSTTTPVQKIITTGKGVAIDFESVSSDSKAQSKELYTWGHSEHEDLKDVTDRLAYLNFVQGSLASSLSTKLDGARAPLKALRDLEASVTPRRNIRAGIHMQITRIEHEQQKGNEKKLADLRDQLKKAEADDQQAEREVEVMKRKAVRESEQLKWDALREYGEKLVLLSQAATPIIAVLPAIPPMPTMPYTGGKNTGAIRASLQRALDNYKTGHINLPSQDSESDLSRSDTRSFGESHATELSSINSEVSSLSAAHTTPSPSTKPLPHSEASQPQGSPPIDVTTLNNSPTPIPMPMPVAETIIDPANPTQTLPIITPTIAETGVPVTSSDPGPSSGSLLDIRDQGLAPPTTPVIDTQKHEPAEEEKKRLTAASVAPVVQGASQATPTSSAPVVEGQKYESAEEEKKRLAAAYSQQTSTEAVAAVAPAVQGPSQVTATAPTAQSEGAEEEKKRLEREERERILRGENPSSKGNDEDLPPYEEPSL